MKTRQKELGDKNLIGKKVTMLRKQHQMKQKDLMAQLQAADIDMNYTSLSKLEGQTRIVTDKELVAIAKIFNLDINDLVCDNDVM